MPELVRLPSGSTAPLVAPSPVSLLCCGGSLEGLAGCVFAHAQVGVGRLSQDDLFAVAEWAVEAFVCGKEAAALAEVCEAYGEAPSRRVGIVEPMLAYVFDRGCLVALADAQSSGENPDPRQGNLEERLRRQEEEDQRESRELEEREGVVKRTMPAPAG